MNQATPALLFEGEERGGAPMVEVSRRGDSGENPGGFDRLGSHRGDPVRELKGGRRHSRAVEKARSSAFRAPSENIAPNETALAWQNTAYNQPPHPSFAIGSGAPTAPRPSITTP